VKVEMAIIAGRMGKKRDLGANCRMGGILQEAFCRKESVLCKNAGGILEWQGFPAEMDFGAELQMP
jgi:hypothetical protein